MSITNTHSWTVASDNGASPLTGTQTETGATLIDTNQSYDIGTSQAIAIAFSKTTLKSLFLLSTKNATLVFTLTTGTVTINLVAGAPYVWDVSPGYFANPFGFDVTSAALTNTVATVLKIRVLY